jgi:hypothetical protein
MSRSIGLAQLVSKHLLFWHHSFRAYVGPMGRCVQILPHNNLRFKNKNIMYNVWPKLNVLVFLCSLGPDLYWLLKPGYARRFFFFFCANILWRTNSICWLISIYVVLLLEWQPSSMTIRVTVLWCSFSVTGACTFFGQKFKVYGRWKLFWILPHHVVCFSISPYDYVAFPVYFSWACSSF